MKDGRGLSQQMRYDVGCRLAVGTMVQKIYVGLYDFSTIHVLVGFLVYMVSVYVWFYVQIVCCNFVCVQHFIVVVAVYFAEQFKLNFLFPDIQTAFIFYFCLFCCFCCWSFSPDPYYSRALPPFLFTSIDFTLCIIYLPIFPTISFIFCSCVPPFHFLHNKFSYFIFATDFFLGYKMFVFIYIQVHVFIQTTSIFHDLCRKKRRERTKNKLCILQKIFCRYVQKN